MSTFKRMAIIFCGVSAFMLVLPVAKADEEDQMTKLTFSAPVEIPGHVLPAGTYWFVVPHDVPECNFVQVFSEDWRTLYATVTAVLTYRQRATDDTELKLAERPHDKPEAILKWYYPGRLMGHEFLYSTRHRKEFGRDAKLDLLVTPINLASNAARNRP
jgi:hypothetical protein